MYKSLKQHKNNLCCQTQRKTVAKTEEAIRKMRKNYYITHVKKNNNNYFVKQKISIKTKLYLRSFLQYLLLLLRINAFFELSVPILSPESLREALYPLEIKQFTRQQLDLKISQKYVQFDGILFQHDYIKSQI